MRDMKLSENGFDIVFNAQNDWDTVTELDEISQSLANLLRTGLGEWFLNNKIGAAWFSILGQTTIDEATFDLVIVQALSFDTRVKSVQNINYTKALRSLTITCDVVLDGQVLELEVTI